MNSLILARVDLHAIFGIVVLVVTVLGWFVNFVQGNNPDGNPRQPRPKPKPQNGRNEIEELLQELSGNKRKPRPEPREQPSRQAKPPVARSKPKQPPQKPVATPISPLSRPLGRGGEPTFASANLGQSIRSHQLPNQIDAAVQKEIVSAVSSDLGTSAPLQPLPTGPVHPLVKVLRDPSGVRQAVLLNEILQRPKSLRG
jgi:hypothetical protein